MNSSTSQRIDFLSPLDTIPGLGPKRLDALAQKEIFTIGDLLYYFPRRYIDRSKVTHIAACEKLLGSTLTVVGTIEQAYFEHGRKAMFKALISDSTGDMELVWFQGAQYLRNKIKKGEKICATGKITYFHHCQMAHPIIESLSNDQSIPQNLFMPIYSLDNNMRESGLQQVTLRKVFSYVLNHVQHYPKVVPETICQKYSFLSLDECLKEIHNPKSHENLNKARERIIYEEIYKLILTQRLSRKHFALPGRPLHSATLPHKLKNILPFKLTKAQEKAIDTLYKDSQSSFRMHRLLQGDVGSGKTLVAIFASLPALENKYQVAWLTPTEILAQQSFATVKRYLDPLGVRIGLLRGGMSSQEKKVMHEKVSTGEIDFIVGTHALLTKDVKFRKLGMIVIDEQHKFGVQQRLDIQQKDNASDFLLMSATPIPQSLAQTLYGDLDIVTLDQVPEGRLPVASHLVPENKRFDMEKFILKEIEAGNQCFWVAPRVEQSDDLSDTISPGTESVITVYNALSKGLFNNVNVKMVHGKLPEVQKREVMESFMNGESKLLVATTVIEVGVDIPSATVMVIEHADLFGLAQLHQLRGRVGRGGKKAYCFLCTESQDPETLKRLQMFCKTHDGFKIAELDLQNRGPGEFSGYKQSGADNLIMADLIKDAHIFRRVNQDLDEFVFKVKK